MKIIFKNNNHFSNYIFKFLFNYQNLKNDYVLEKNRVLVNDKLIQSDSLDRLIVLKENKKFLGVPVQSLIYQSGLKY